MEDDHLPPQADNPQENDDVRELSPEEELDADINNLSIEDSVAGPVVRISDNQVSTIPDSLPLSNHSRFEKSFAIDYTDNSNTTSQDCNLDNIENSVPIPSSRNRTSNTSRFTLKAMSRIPIPLITNPSTKETPAITSTPDTPFSSATDLVTDKSTGAISKTSTSNKPSQNTSDIPRGCVPITSFFNSRQNPANPRRIAPNICNWDDEDPTPWENERPQNTQYSATNANGQSNDPNFDRLPQRPSRKRARILSSNSSLDGNRSNPTVANTTSTGNINQTQNVDTLTTKSTAPANSLPTVQEQQKHNNTKNVSFSLQGGNDEYLPIPAEGLPFFRRARGCYSAEARAQTRAEHLDRLSDNGKPPRWAFGIGPMPSFVQSFAKDLINIKRRHSLELTRAVARSLRDSALSSRRQGNLNLDTVRKIYANNETGFDQASVKLTALVSRDNTQENERLSRREELISRSPTTDDDLVNLLSGFKIAPRSYAAVVNNDPPQANQNGNQAAARQDNNAGPQRQNRRARSRSRSRNRNGRRNNDNLNARNNSRSPIRQRDNNRADNLNRQGNRVANQGRRPDNNRRQQRNRYRERDSASEFMDKMFEFFKRR